MLCSVVVVVDLNLVMQHSCCQVHRKGLPLWESFSRAKVLHMVNRRNTGVICGVCGDVVREVKWIQPCLEIGVGDSVAFVERGCLCGWVPIAVDTIEASNMRMVEQMYEIQQAFKPGLFQDPYGRSSQ